MTKKFHKLIDTTYVATLFRSRVKEISPVENDELICSVTTDSVLGPYYRSSPHDAPYPLWLWDAITDEFFA